MYVVFARKYRPERFEDVVGQEHITRTLQNAVRADRVAHAYLFCGSRGVGKTTVARILAKALNCAEGPTPQPCGGCTSCRRIATGDDLDVMEIDGASNRGIDQVRDLRQNVSLAPAHSRFKIYYIDEVHMLTEPAFNALLKTLEEPPGHVKFIFSTTDPQKLPETVKSRCQRFDFRRVPDREIVDYLLHICQEEGLEVEDGGLAAIARAARGGMRDALGALDQLAAFGNQISMADVHSVLGTVDRTSLTRIVDALHEEDTATALRTADELLFSGTDVEDLADQFSQHLRDLLVAKYCDPDDSVLAGAAAGPETLARQSELFTADQLTYMVQVLREAKLRARRDSTGRIALELAVIKMSRMSQLVPVADALESIEQGGGPPSSPGGGQSPSADTGRGGTAQTGQAGAPSTRARATLKRISQKLNNRKPGRAAASPAARENRAAGESEEEEDEPAEPGPPADILGDIDETTYRQLVHSAEEPEVAREALSQQPLLKAYLEADRVLGLNPLAVQRLGAEKAGEKDEIEADEQDRTED